MKSNKISKMCVLILMTFGIMSFTNLPPQKEKNDKSGEQSRGKGEGRENKDKGNERDDKDYGKDNDHQRNKNEKNNNSDDNYKSKGRDNSDKMNEKFNKSEMKNGKDKGENMRNWKNSNIIWDLDDSDKRKGPGKQKKVTVCHHPGGDEYPVTLNISENALQAHLNHGDERGDCNVDYSDRWSKDYVKSRETVYNTWENTWETMSYSDALLKYAMDKLLGVRSNLNDTRSGLTTQQIQRREALILDLQNNVNGLQNQLDQTRQLADANVNIIVKL